MSLQKEDVEHIAILARIKLSDEEKSSFTEKLSGILDWVKELEEAPTEGIEPINQIAELENVMREDKAKEGLSIDQVLLNAPQKKDNFIKVKQVFE